MKKLGFILMTAAVILFFYLMITFPGNPQSRNAYTVLGFLSAMLGFIGVLLSVTGEE